MIKIFKRFEKIIIIKEINKSIVDILYKNMQNLHYRNLKDYKFFYLLGMDKCPISIDMYYSNIDAFSAKFDISINIYNKKLFKDPRLRELFLEYLI